MESYKLYEIKIENLEKEITSLKIELEKQDLIKLVYKEEISKWNKKYKDLKNQMMGKG
jgi:predicted  nucleic acid-binding Zn-ribbon protein